MIRRALVPPLGLAGLALLSLLLLAGCQTLPDDLPAAPAQQALPPASAGPLAEVAAEARRRFDRYDQRAGRPAFGHAGKRDVLDRHAFAQGSQLGESSLAFVAAKRVQNAFQDFFGTENSFVFGHIFITKYCR